VNYSEKGGQAEYLPDARGTSMTATILDGREVAKSLHAEIETRVTAFSLEHGRVPSVAVVRVGDDAGAAYYERTLARSFDKLGLGFRSHVLPARASQQTLLAQVEHLNVDPDIDGIIVMEPLPEHIDRATLKNALSPGKDVDGIHPLNTGRLAQVAPIRRPKGVGPYLVPATPAGGMAILCYYDVPIAGRDAVVVGRSNIVGKPMGLLLLRANATVTFCHSRTQDLAAICRTGDILCGAVGSANLIRGDWIKPGAVVLDFGVNFVEGEMVGDVAFEEALEVSSMITPVPGGTGPVTTVMLMCNVLHAAEQQARKV
jgi:methylenetetrahydrofolate dehydrogenase (NADP+) / methenyltetrahydrofolate cyclohydrolase